MEQNIWNSNCQTLGSRQQMTVAPTEKKQMSWALHILHHPAWRVSGISVRGKIPGRVQSSFQDEKTGPWGFRAWAKTARIHREEGTRKESYTKNDFQKSVHGFHFIFLSELTTNWHYSNYLCIYHLSTPILSPYLSHFPPRSMPGR